MSTLGMTSNIDYILACLKRRPMTVSELKMGHAVSSQFIENDIKTLEEDGLIEFVDDRSGYRIVHRDIEETVEG